MQTSRSMLSENIHTPKRLLFNKSIHLEAFCALEE